MALLLGSMVSKIILIGSKRVDLFVPCACFKVLNRKI